MRSILKAKNNPKNYGFTLIEVTVVVIILAILASVALARYTGAIERSRAAEGTYILGTLLSSMERYNLEYGTFPSAIGSLDVPSVAAKNFNPATITILSTCASGSACAQIDRNGAVYTLEIDRDGTICCTEGGGSPDCSDTGIPGC